MADISKTVAVIFTADTGGATAKIDEIAASLGKVGDPAGNAKLGETATAIEKVGTSSGTTATAATALAGGMRKLAEDAGVPKGALDGLDGTLTKLAASGGSAGSLVVAGAAIAAMALVVVKAGGDADRFKTSLDNLSGGARDSQADFEFVRKAVDDLEVNLADALDVYAKFLVKIDGTGIPARAAEDAFRGITAAVKAQGGDLRDTEKALKDFADVAADGSVDLKELEGKLDSIPGGLRIFAEALGVPVEDLRLLAENGQLGKEAIEAFAAALNGQEYASLTPVKDAFTDLWNEIQRIAVDLGGEQGFTAVMLAIETSVRAVTFTMTSAEAIITAFGQTLANIAFSIANLDFAGFVERQNEIEADFNAAAQRAGEKFGSLEKQVENTKAGEASEKYKGLVDQIKATGDEADKTAPKAAKLTTETDRGEKAALALAKASAESERAIADQAKAFQQAEKDANEFALELEKIASNERIKFIEATVALNTAQLEADTKRVEAAFESIDNTVSTVGKNIDTLYGQLGNFDDFSWSAQDIFEDQLDIQNKRMEKELALQEKLITAQVANLQAQTQAMQRGDAMIKISGDGLKPHLEAFMWEILTAIQVRVNQQGRAMLLGM